MRLISIGRSRTSTIRLDSEYVSAHHAELLLLDNGDIFLTDCGSRQGTFVFGKKIEPGVEVPVRRGDKIEFDNIPLNWAQVPMITLPDPATVKGIYGVGRSTRNRYQLSGDSVSRYHATFKEMKDGKWYIQDHSTSGTFINGQRIPSDQDVRIRPKDLINCGSVSCPNPITGSSVSGAVWTAVCIAAACVVLFFGIWGAKYWLPGWSFNPKKAVVYIREEFALKVVFEDDPVKAREGRDWYLARLSDGSFSLTLGIEDAYIMGNSGTGFFVSDKGHIITNRHVTNWVWADKIYSNSSQSQRFRSYVEVARTHLAHYLAMVLSVSDEEMEGIYYRIQKSRFELEVKPIRFLIGYSDRNYSDASEMDMASLIDEAKDDRIDMALLQLNKIKTPDFATHFVLNKSLKDIDELSEKQVYHTVGFPGGLAMSRLVDSNLIHSTSGQLHLVQNPGKYTLVFNGDSSICGQSGSPIFDKRNRLIGVLYGGYAGTNTTAACPIMHACDIFGSTIGL